MIFSPSRKRDTNRIVIVDDSRTMQAILEQLVTVRMGWEVVGIAGDGRSALPMIRRLMPDLVTIDLQMPYLDGGQLLAELQGLSDIRKVVLSGNSGSNVAIKAHLEDLGADACIAKSEMSRDPEAFCKTLADILRKPSASDVDAPKRLSPVRPLVASGYPIPFDERERLAALAAANLANDDPDRQLDLLTTHLGKTTSFSASVITFIDQGTQWIKSAHGMERGSTPREYAICNHTLCGEDPFIVEDLQADRRFNKLPFVLSGPRIRSYVGYPIISFKGVKLGAICLLDTKPRRIKVTELTNLRSIARIAAELTESPTVTLRRVA